MSEVRRIILCIPAEIAAALEILCIPSDVHLNNEFVDTMNGLLLRPALGDKSLGDELVLPSWLSLYSAR